MFNKAEVFVPVLQVFVSLFLNNSSEDPTQDWAAVNQVKSPSSISKQSSIIQLFTSKMNLGEVKRKLKEKINLKTMFYAEHME